jgi:hypothetical protein
LFLRYGGNIYPVFCVSPADSRPRDLLNNQPARAGDRASAEESLGREEDDVKRVGQECETVFQSIHLKDGATPQGVPGSNKVAAVEQGIAPAANTASMVNTPASSADPAPVSGVPDGFKVLAFTYCKSPTNCWDASIFVPSDAQLVSSDCKQYVYQMTVKGAPFLLLAGSTAGCNGRSAIDASQVRWKQLVDSESERAPGTASTISSQQMTLEGNPAVVTKMRFKKGIADWIAKRAEVESNGSQLVVGCMSPKETFGDGDAVCSGLIDSLRLP